MIVHTLETQNLIVKNAPEKPSRLSSYSPPAGIQFLASLSWHSSRLWLQILRISSHQYPATKSYRSWFSGPCLIPLRVVCVAVNRADNHSLTARRVLDSDSRIRYSWPRAGQDTRRVSS